MFVEETFGRMWDRRRAEWRETLVKCCRKGEGMKDKRYEERIPQGVIQKAERQDFRKNSGLYI